MTSSQPTTGASAAAPAAGLPSAASSSSSQRPTSHTQRYDRQLRLWASSGQASLERSSILLLGCTATGCAALKNVILPGVGRVCIVDPRPVSEVDLGVNFFLAGEDEEAKQDHRADRALKLLLELNPSVKGEARHNDILTLISDPANIPFLTSFSLIIASEQPPHVLQALSELCWNAASSPSSSSSAVASASIPLLSIKVSGFLASLQFQVKELGIIETHPESLISMRLASPWSELEKYANDFELQPKDSMERQHVPFIIILLRMLDKWKKEHDGALPNPTSTSERQQFIESVRACRHPDEADAENIDEALSAIANHIWRPLRQIYDAQQKATAEGSDALAKLAPGVPDEIKALFEDESCTKLTANSSHFWILVRALRSFVYTPPTASPPGGGGFLPQPGTLPDMKALSGVYIALQKLYHGKSDDDLHAFKQHLDLVVRKELGIDGGADAVVPEEEVRQFVKHAAFLKVIRGRKLADMDQSPREVDSFTAFSTSYQPATLPFHIAFTASSQFLSEHGRLPGSSAAFTRVITSATETPESSQNTEEETDVEADQAAMRAACKKLAVKFGADISDEDVVEVIEQAADEVTRGGHSSLPSTAALTGGIAAQEIIKLLTRQYIPADNTIVYNGIQQSVGVFRL